MIYFIIFFNFIPLKIIKSFSVLFSRICKSFSFSVSNTIIEAQSLFPAPALTPIHTLFFTYFIVFSIEVLNRIGDKMQHYLTPSPILVTSTLSGWIPII